MRKENGSGMYDGCGRSDARLAAKGKFTIGLSDYADVTIQLTGQVVDAGRLPEKE